MRIFIFEQFLQLLELFVSLLALIIAMQADSKESNKEE